MCQLILELPEEENFHHQIVPDILFWNAQQYVQSVVQTPEYCMYFSSEARLWSLTSLHSLGYMNKVKVPNSSQLYNQKQTKQSVISSKPEFPKFPFSSGIDIFQGIWCFKKTDFTRERALLQVHLVLNSYSNPKLVSHMLKNGKKCNHMKLNSFHRGKQQSDVIFLQITLRLLLETLEYKFRVSALFSDHRFEPKLHGAHKLWG